MAQRSTLSPIETIETIEDLSPEERHDTVHALKKAYTWITGVMWMWRIGALAYAVATLFAVLALARTDVPAGEGTLVVLLTTSLTVLMLFAAIQVLFRPFVWTVAIAVLATIVTIVHAMGPNPYGVASIASALWAVVAWGALLPTYRIRQMIEDHKDLYILHHASMRTRRSIKGRTPEDRHRRLVAAMQRASRRAWKVSTTAAAVVCLASLFGTRQVLANLRPELFGDAVQRFEAAWNGSDLEAMRPCFHQSVRAAQVKKLGAIAAGSGWAKSFPTLPAPRTREEEGMTVLDYDVPTGVLSASFALIDQRWVIVDTELPYPPLEDTLTAFLEDWKLGDPEKLASYFRPESHEKMRNHFEAAKTNRSWSSFPEVRKVRRAADDPRETVVDLVLDEDEATLKWHFREDGSWTLHGLKLPPIKVKRDR